MEPDVLVSIDEIVARACHEVNRAYCDLIGDYSQVAWADAPQWQRDSAINGVALAAKGATSEELHQSWCDQKVADGWVFGEVKDAEAKTHPCLVPYDALPEAQRAKDALFGLTVKALLEMYKRELARRFDSCPPAPDNVPCPSPADNDD